MLPIRNCIHPHTLFYALHLHFLLSVSLSICLSFSFLCCVLIFGFRVYGLFLTIICGFCCWTLLLFALHILGFFYCNSCFAVVRVHATNLRSVVVGFFQIHDSTLSGSSDDDDFLGALRGPSSFANAFLYVGLGTVALGLVIVFVGTGEKGFKTGELRLIGPSLIGMRTILIFINWTNFYISTLIHCFGCHPGIGLLCCMLRIFFCICPSSCITSKRRKLKQKNAKVDVDHTTSLLCADNKRVLITRSNEVCIAVFQQQF